MQRPRRRAVAASVLVLCLGPAALAVGSSPFFAPAGIDQSARDGSVRPGDDFYQYVNGAWLARTPLKGGEVSTSLAGDVDQRVEERLHALLEAAALVPGTATSTEGKVGAMYAAFMDEARVDSLGATPIRADIDAIYAATTRYELATLMGRNHHDFGGSLFELGVDADLGDPGRYALYVGQSGLGMPGREYYFSNEFRMTRAAYRSYIERMLTLIGWRDPGTTAGAIYALEARVAEASWSRTEQGDVRRLYNPMSPAELERLAPGFEWQAFLGGAGAGDRPRIIVAEYSAFPKLAAIYADAPLDTLKAWQAYRLVDGAAKYLSSDFQQAYFDFRRKTLLARTAQEPRWKRALDAVSGGNCAGEARECFGTLSWAVGEVYRAHDFTPDTKAKAERLAASLLRALRVRLEDLTWMAPATKAAALAKLDTYSIKVGYQDHARSYAGVDIGRNDLVGDVRRAARANWEYDLARVGTAVDRGEWQMTPQTVDSYTGPARDIVFPAALLQPPLYDPAADDAVNYGSIGVAIAHELIHGFDEQGRTVDAGGASRDWWTPTDAAAYKARANALGAQYSAFEPLPGLHVDAQLTMDENIADLGGLLVALDAYHASLKGHAAAVIGGLTGDQRFFTAYAQSLRGQVREDVLRHQVLSDPHAYRKFRVLGPIRNIDAWYDAFKVREGDKLYLAPGDRVRLW